MELTLTHLSNYLPYNLYVHDSYDNVETNLCGIIYDDIEPIRLGKKGRVIQSRRLDEIKPILRDSSSIKSMISNNGECFMPFNRLNDIMTLGDNEIYLLNNFIESPWTYYFLPSWILEKLIEWRFDIFSLIDSDLAINLNTLKENPYK